MSHKYSTALSHAILAGTGIYCFSKFYSSNKVLNFPCITFGIVITNSVIGVWRWGNPDYGDKVEQPYNVTFFLQSIFALPCIAGQIWLNTSYEKIIGYLHPGLSLIPLAAYLGDKDNSDLVEILMFLNVLSCGTISFLQEEYYGVAAAVAYAINQFIIKKKDEIFEVPSKDFYNYALCFFTYFSYKALTS